VLSIAGWPCGSNSQPDSIITASPMALTAVATAGLTALPNSSYPNCAPTAPPTGTPAPQQLIPQQLQWSI